MNRQSTTTHASVQLTLAAALVCLGAAPPADARRSQSLQDVPASITALSEAGIETMHTRQLAELTSITPTLRTGLDTAGGATLQVRGSFDEPTMTIDGVPLNFAASGGIDFVDLDRVEVLRGPQGTLSSGRTEPSLFGQAGPVDLFALSRDFSAINDAQARLNQPLLDQLTSAQADAPFTNVDASGLLGDTAGQDPCSPEYFRFLTARSLLTEDALQAAAIDRYTADLGMRFAASMGEEKYLLGYRTLRANADQRISGYTAQYQALRDAANPFLEGECAPFQGDSLPPDWFDVTLNLDPDLRASAAPFGAADLGSRRPGYLHTEVTGPVTAPDTRGQWNVTPGIRFTDDWAFDRLNGNFSARCEAFTGTDADLREYAFSAALRRKIASGGLDLSIPLVDLPATRDGNDFQSLYAQSYSMARDLHCADPLDYSRGLNLNLDLTRNLYRRGLDLGYADAASRAPFSYDLSRGSLRLQSKFDFDFRGAGRGDQRGYDAVPTYLDAGRAPALTPQFGRFQIRRGLDYQPLTAYTLPNISPSDAFAPSCFDRPNYGTFNIGSRSYLRGHINPDLVSGLNINTLDGWGLRLDPWRGPLNDPYMNTPGAGGGAWGQPFEDQWAIQRVGFIPGRESAWQALEAAGGTEVIVAVIDSGLDWHHEDLVETNLWRNADEIPGNGIDDDANGYVDDVVGYDFMEDDAKPWDHHGHGTMVAGIIAAARDNRTGIAGLNPHARLMTLKVGNSFGNTRASYIAEAIAYAVDNGAQVINISMGGHGRSPLEAQAIEYARAQGVLIIAAAGNTGIALDDFWPAAEEGVLTVAATGHDDQPAAFSNSGDPVDIAAPGVDVLSLRARGTDVNLGASGETYAPGANMVGDDRRYIHASGTSFAAPIVTGTASLLLAVSPELSTDQVRQRLLDTAWDIGQPGRDPKSGAGLLDARTALSVDPNYFVAAQIEDLVPNGKDQTLEIRGLADADQFKRAWLQIGEGEDPGQWKYVGLKIKRPVKNGLLSEIPLSEFEGTGVWTVRLNVEHASGIVRQAVRPIRLR